MDFEIERAGYVGLVIVPQKEMESKLPEIIQSVEENLKPRLLLTTHLQVVGPKFLPISIETTLVPLADVKEEELKPRVNDALKKFLHPLDGGDDEKGWPFGRNVFVSEIYELLDQLPGVDYVTSVDLSTMAPDRRIETKNQDDKTVLVGIEVKPYELVSAQITVNTNKNSR
jgi:hypothetical protein